MARIQILELPMVHKGDEAETPFVILIDQATEEEAEILARNVDAASAKTGARATIITTGTLDVA